MTEEEMAEEYKESKRHKCFRADVGKIQIDYETYLNNLKEGFLAGLKAGRPQWHDLEKEPTDLPKDNHNVWCKALDHYGEGWYDKDTNTWTLIYRGYHLHCIEAWCEIPTFDKE